MAALFAGASTQYLVTSTPIITDYAVTVGMWINLRAASTVVRTLWGLSDTATTTNYLRVQMSTGESVQTSGRSGGTENVITAGGITAGRWCFVLARFISAANRRLSTLNFDGTVTHASTATSRAPAGMDTMTIGALSTSGGITEPWDGLIAEYWLTNADVCVDTAADTPAALLFQLAYGSPFSVPHIADDIIEYRSFRKHPASDADDLNEVFYAGNGRQIWTNTNGVTTAWHPPLPYWYVKPGQTQRVLTI